MMFFPDDADEGDVLILLADYFQFFVRFINEDQKVLIHDSVWEYNPENIIRTPSCP